MYKNIFERIFLNMITIIAITTIITMKELLLLLPFIN